MVCLLAQQLYSVKYRKRNTLSSSYYTPSRATHLLVCEPSVVVCDALGQVKITIVPVIMAVP